MPLDGAETTVQQERWHYHGARPDTFDIAVTVGKTLDVIGLKGSSLQETRDYAAHLRRTADRLYAAGAPRRRVESCPCCEAPTVDARVSARIFDIDYYACSVCGHGFVREQPSQEALGAIFALSEQHSETYIDMSAAEFRIENVVMPKLDWLNDVYRGHYGRLPTSLIDVGAGGGHFVAAARRRGIAADGFEVSHVSRRFADAAFGLSLHNADFLSEPAAGPIDVVTMWGLLEYTPEPRRFMAAARKRIAADGLLVVEVPRLNCLGTAAQRLAPDNVARHLDPTTHVNTFSDASLATALVESGFRPVAAGYFGMDAYELLVQQALRLKDDGVVAALGDMITGLQQSLDGARLCDDIVIAAVPG
jgi:2-polyprenyl-3-methyl-5-hydroxy-6-metoxy-1,4-benzoquinol methylase